MGNDGKADFVVFLSRKFAFGVRSGFSCGICETSTLRDSFAILDVTSSFRARNLHETFVYKAFRGGFPETKSMENPQESNLAQKWV